MGAGNCPLKTTYAYDASGNRISKESPEGTTHYQYNEKNQLVSENGIRGRNIFTYSRGGSIIKEEGDLNTWHFINNSKNQQIKVTCEDGQTQVNRYDSEGLRYEMKENEKLFRFIYHRGELLHEEGQEGQISYHLGGGTEAIQQNQKVYYYHQDEQLSTALITDDTGQIQNQYQYGAFGEELGQTEKISNRIRYTGQQSDRVTNQLYLRARFYNPVIGRFTQEDVYQGDGLNLYTYCHNNPVVYYDPSGYSSECPPRANLNGDGGNGAVTQTDFIVGPDGTVVSSDVYNMSNADFVQEVANIANLSVNEQRIADGKSTTGHVAGSLKHGQAANIAENYQNSIADRGLEIEQSYYGNTPITNNQSGSTRLDVYDTTANQVYDYKFVVNPGKGLSKGQTSKITNQGPAGLSLSDIHEVNPK